MAIKDWERSGLNYILFLNFGLYFLAKSLNQTVFVTLLEQSISKAGCLAKANLSLD